MGRGYYIPITIYVEASSAREAAEFARKTPRVKHDHKDCILGVSEISASEYYKGREKNRLDPYFRAKNIQEQRAYPEIFDRLVPEKHCEDDRRSKNRKRLSERNPKRFLKMQMGDAAWQDEVCAVAYC